MVVDRNQPAGDRVRDVRVNGAPIDPEAGHLIVEDWKRTSPQGVKSPTQIDGRITSR